MTHKFFRRALVALGITTLGGCEYLTTPEGLTTGIVATTIIGAAAPTSDIRQIYYLGMFDPQGQMPPQMYRIRVNGQSSFLSRVNFASGWVPADLIDSLGGQVKQAKDGALSFNKTGDGTLSQLTPGRRLVMFGPEGFREAPADHRLVVVMGSSPEEYFEAVDQTLGMVAGAIDQQRGSALQQDLFQALLRLKEEQGRLRDLATDLEVDKARALNEAAR